ncbi:MAG: orotate phosphoribosyltransferase [FCB group bacterium]|jgi:orotate phosphoribosyltransferase
MTKTELAKTIFKTSHLTGTFELRSGAMSNEYFDKYQFESQPDILGEIIFELIPLIEHDYDYIAGLEMGGIPIATALSLETGKPVIFIRKKPKEHGTKKFAEGPDIKGKRLLIIEDVVTSGGQIILSVEDLRNAGAIVNHAICVIDRQSGGKEKLKEKNIELISLFKMSELLEAAK